MTCQFLICRQQGKCLYLEKPKTKTEICPFYCRIIWNPLQKWILWTLRSSDDWLTERRVQTCLLLTLRCFFGSRSTSIDCWPPLVLNLTFPSLLFLLAALALCTAAAASSSRYSSTYQPCLYQFSLTAQPSSSMCLQLPYLHLQKTKCRYENRLFLYQGPFSMLEAQLVINAWQQKQRSCKNASAHTRKWLLLLSLSKKSKNRGNDGYFWH